MEVRITRSYTRFLREYDDLRNFPAFIEEYFYPFIKSGEENGKFEWSSVNIFYSNYQDRLANCHSLNIFRKFVIKLLLKFNCEDEMLLLSIIYIGEIFRTNEYRDVLNHCPDCIELNCLYRDHFIDTRSILMEINELPRSLQIRREYPLYPYVHWKGTVYEQFKLTNRYTYMLLTNEMVRKGDFTVLQVLVKYGLSHLADDEMLPNLDPITVLEERIWWRFTDLVEEYDKWRRFPERSRDEFSRLLNRVLQENPNKRRLLLKIEMVLNFFTEMTFCTEKDGHAKCISLLCLTISEPAISEKEIINILGSVFGTDEAVKREVLLNFNEMFSDSPNLPSARTLKFLCRTKIRDYLSRLPQLPNVLSEIEIPNYLKNYLLFLCN